MIQITADNVTALNKKYAQWLGPNNEAIKVNDVLFNELIKGGIGTTSANSDYPWLQEGSTFWVDPTNLDGCQTFWLANIGSPWKVKNIRIRVIPIKQFVVKQNPDSSYSAVRWYLPENFDIDLSCKQFPGLTRNPEVVYTRDRFPFIVDGDGAEKHHLIDLHADGSKNHCVFKCFGVIGSSFSGFRLFQNERTRIITGEISDFYMSGPKSETNYWGSIRPLHGIFKNFKVKNGLCANAGTELLQMLNMGEGVEISNITLIQSATQSPSPFQNWQYGTIDLKAGGGSLQMSKIYLEMGGSSAINLYSSAPVKDLLGRITQEGAKPGDVVTISDFYVASVKGSFVYVNDSSRNGVEWRFKNVTVGGYTSRMSDDTGIPQAHGFLSDFGTNATDKVIVEGITTDKSLPLGGRGIGKYQVSGHTVVDEIKPAKFINRSFEHNEIVIAYYHVYNQVSQKQFYKVAGQPVKYKKGDIAYYDQKGQSRTWFKALMDVEGTATGPGKNWEQLFWDDKGIRSDKEGFNKATARHYPPDYFVQAPDSHLLNKVGFEQETGSTEPTNELEELKKQNMALAEELKALAEKAQVVETENTNLKQENQALTQKQIQVATAAREALDAATKLLNILNS